MPVTPAYLALLPPYIYRAGLCTIVNIHLLHYVELNKKCIYHYTIQETLVMII